MGTSELCSSCHQVFFKTLYGKLLQVQNGYDTWKSSKYDQGPGHPKTRTCQDCHMPLGPSSAEPSSPLRPAAERDEGSGG
jgi:hypothetical protein